MMGRLFASRPLLAPGKTWFRLADWLLAAADEFRRARERGRGRQQ